LYGAHRRTISDDPIQAKAARHFATPFGNLTMQFTRFFRCVASFQALRRLVRIDDNDHGKAPARVRAGGKRGPFSVVKFLSGWIQKIAADLAATVDTAKRFRRRTKRRGDSLQQIRIAATVIIRCDSDQSIVGRLQPLASGLIQEHDPPLFIERIDRLRTLLEQGYKSSFGISTGHGY